MTTMAIEIVIAILCSPGAENHALLTLNAQSGAQGREQRADEFQKFQ